MCNILWWMKHGKSLHKAPTAHLRSILTACLLKVIHVPFSIFSTQDGGLRQGQVRRNHATVQACGPVEPSRVLQVLHVQMEACTSSPTMDFGVRLCTQTCAAVQRIAWFPEKTCRAEAEIQGKVFRWWRVYGYIAICIDRGSLTCRRASTALLVHNGGTSRKLLFCLILSLILYIYT